MTAVSQVQLGPSPHLLFVLQSVIFNVISKPKIYFDSTSKSHLYMTMSCHRLKNHTGAPTLPIHKKTKRQKDRKKRKSEKQKNRTLSPQYNAFLDFSSPGFLQDDDRSRGPRRHLFGCRHVSQYYPSRRHSLKRLRKGPVINYCITSSPALRTIRACCTWVLG